MEGRAPGEGRARAILLRHVQGYTPPRQRHPVPPEAAGAAAAHPAAPSAGAMDGALQRQPHQPPARTDPFADDPNAFRPARDVAAALAALEAEEGDLALRRAAADYVALWARTFRTLVRHLRGRPERAIALFASEVYPFLRGDRLAARVETAEPGRARLLLLADLPPAYLAGLVESFVRLSGARADCVAAGGGRFDVRYRVAPVDRLVPLAQQLAALRIHLVVAAAVACAVGVALAAARSPEPLALGRIGAVLAGGVAAQVGANAWHDLRHPHPAGPLRLLAPSRAWLLWQARAGYGVATLCGAALAIDAPVVLLFAAAGLAVSALFGRLRTKGWGPLLAGITYGPLIAGGAYHAFLPLDLSPAVALPNLLPSLALGATAAALLHLDDLADRPLDEAGGQRTLAVRLPRQRQALVLDALLAMGVAAAAATVLAPGWLPGAGGGLTGLAGPAALAGLALLATVCVAIAALAHRNLDEPAGLAPARLALLLVHAGLGALLVASAGGLA